MAEINYLFDEHMPSAIVHEVRRLSIDVLTAREAGLRTQPDDVYLPFAVMTSRVLVTLDNGFVSRHHLGEVHAGIVYAKPRTVTIGDFVEYLVLLHGAYDMEYMVGRLERIADSL